VVSNHGGRQLDTARSGIEILEEVVLTLERHKIPIGSRRGGFEILVDGGFRRGADIFKALALGASGIGLGRPTLYAMSSYGQEGVERLVDVLEDELIMTMRLMGCPTVHDIRRGMVITKDLSTHVGTQRDFLNEGVYDSLKPVVSFKANL
jgi:L-lactate dehydrogenase (cytochrome)